MARCNVLSVFRLMFAVVMTALIATAVFGQKVTSFNVTTEMVLEAQQAWGKGLIKISETHAAGGDYRKVAEEILDFAYNYDDGIVLFKPTLTTGERTFRKDRAGALAYFIGGDKDYPEDTGFALRGWKSFKIDTRGIILNGSSAISMGHVHLFDKNGSETIVDKTWGYKLEPDGGLKIILHHSSLPYKPAK